MNHYDASELLRLVDHVEASGFDYAEIQLGDLKLVLSKTGTVHRSGEALSLSAAPTGPLARGHGTDGQSRPAVQTGQPAGPGPAGKAGGDCRETVSILSPMVGLFYGAREPGAPPFVRVDEHVEAETTVGLIEVMKVFSAVKARVQGVIAEILVQNGDFVEFGQPLMAVVPDDGGSFGPHPDASSQAKEATA